MSNSLDLLRAQVADSNVAVEDILRQAMVVAAHSGDSGQELSAWFQDELRGYKKTADTPEFRCVHGEVRARTAARWLPVQFSDAEFAALASRASIGEPVAEITSFLARGTVQFYHVYPPELLDILQRMFKVETEFACFIDRARFVGVLDEIRTRVLRWVIELDRSGVSKREKTGIKLGSVGDFATREIVPLVRVGAVETLKAWLKTHGYMP